MRSLLALVLLAGTAHAHELACPARHPDASQARLIGAGVHDGPHHEYELAGGEYKKAPGGHDLIFNFPGNEVKWLACAYDDRQLWWLQMDQHTTDCRLQVRGERQVSAKMTCTRPRSGVQHPSLTTLGNTARHPARPPGAIP